MPDNVDARITPSLHPDNVKSIDGFDEQTAPYLAPTMTVGAHPNLPRCAR